MDGVTLLRQAGAAGLAVTAEGDKRVIRGPKRAELVARLLIQHKPKVLAALTLGKHSADLVGRDHSQRVAHPTWQVRYSARIVHWFPAAHRQWHEAEAIAYGELLKEWHERYGALPDPGRCAGCSDELPDVWGSFCAMAPGYISTACMAPIASSPTAGGGVAPPLQRCACSARTARRLRAVVMDDFTLTQTSEVDFPYGEREGESQLPESASTPSAPLSAPASSNAIRRPRRVLPAEQVGNEIALAINPASLCAALGIDDPNVATRLLSHLVNVYQSLAFKAMRTFAQLLDTLYHGRGKGVTQQIIVKYVIVEAGAQAVLGSIDARTGGGGVPKSEDQSCAARPAVPDAFAAKEQNDRST